MVFRAFFKFAWPSGAPRRRQVRTTTRELNKHTTTQNNIQQTPFLHAPGQASNKTSQIAPKSDRPAAKMTPRNGPGAAQEAPRRPQERPRSAQERPKRDQKGIKNELRLPADPWEPSGRHFGAIFEPPGVHFGQMFAVFQGPLRRGGAPEKSRDVV